MTWKHYFQCGSCGKHLNTITDYDAPWIPGRTHKEALEEGAFPAVTKDAGGESCLGVMTYCSGYDVKNEKRCPSHSKGSEKAQVRNPPKNPEWNAFCDRVTAGWTAFVRSGYSASKRGVNNFREYKPSAKVMGVLQNAQGAVKIDGAVYTISNSKTSGASLHRTIPAAYQAGNMKSFIYHL